jgi:hypothetical protein
MMVTLNDTKRLLAENIPSAELRRQPVSDWKGEFQLPEIVIAYYDEVGPVDVSIEAYGNPWILPSLANLWEFQAGYRYHASSLELLTDWNDDWLVIVYEGGDPFILSRSTGQILLDWHGRGRWNPAPIFDNLPVMVCSFAILGGIALREGENLFCEDSAIKTAFLSEARNRITEVAESDTKAAKILNQLGWAQDE